VHVATWYELHVIVDTIDDTPVTTDRGSNIVAATVSESTVHVIVYTRVWKHRVTVVV